MVTNKSAAIRLGLTKNWQIQFASKDSDYHKFSINFRQFIDTFFSDSTFRDRGIAYSHSNIGHIRNFSAIQVFFQDAKISDFIVTFPRRSAFTIRSKKRGRFGKKLYRANGSFRSSQFSIKFHKLFFRKRFVFFNSARRYMFSPINLSRKVLHSSHVLKLARMRRVRRYSRFKKTYFTNFYNYFYSTYSCRLSYYSFFCKMLSKFFFSFFGSPLLISLNHIVPRHATPNLYLNYICTKLYYRYILSDVVNPIVRLSLRQYRGFSINCKGRFTRAQIATQKSYRRGALSFSYIKNHLDYAQKAVTLKYGTCNLKLWIRR